MRRAVYIALTAAVALAAAAHAQSDEATALRSSGVAGEQADGYLGATGAIGDADQARIDAVNIKRRAYYTDLAAKRNARVSEVAATTACELFRTKVGPGQWYRGPDGVWKRRDGNAPVPLPGYCG